MVAALRRFVRSFAELAGGSRFDRVSPYRRSPIWLQRFRLRLDFCCGGSGVGVGVGDAVGVGSGVATGGGVPLRLIESTCHTVIPREMSRSSCAVAAGYF